MAGKETVPTGSSDVGEIDALVKLLGGTTAKQTTTANTAPLDQVFQQLLASSGDNQALLDSIFAQAATKIPGIMGNTYNATGSRQAPGTLSPQLAKLQADVTLAAQQQLAQQKLQQLTAAGQVAGNIAGATRAVTTKDGNSLTGLSQKLGLLLTANNLAKSAGIDVGKKAKDLWSDWTADPSAAVSNFSLDSPVTSMPDFSNLNFASAPVSSSLLDSGGSFQDFGQSLLSPEFTSAAASAANAANSAAVSDYTGTDWPNFSPDTGSAAASVSQTSQAASASQPTTSPGSSTASEAAAVLKLLDYAGNPKKRGDILDFSDGDWKDDIGDITDAASVYFPPAAMVRPALTQGEILYETLGGRSTASSQYLQGLTSTVQPGADIEDAPGKIGGPIGQAVYDTTKDVGNFFNNPGEAIKSWFGG